MTNKFYPPNIFDIGVYSIGVPTKGTPLSNVGLNFLKEEPLELGNYQSVCNVRGVGRFGFGYSKSSMVPKSPATEAVATDCDMPLFFACFSRNFLELNHFYSFFSS